MPTTKLTWNTPTGAGATWKGKTLSIAGALAGETVTWEQSGERGRRVDGRVVSIDEPSPDRIEPTCPDYDACGGCGLAQLRNAGRAGWIAGVASHALRTEVGFTASPREVAHRARIKLAIEGGEVGYRKARSHELVPFARCGIARPEVSDALDALRAHGVPDAEEVEIRTDGKNVAYDFRGSARAPDLSGLGNASWNGKKVAGSPTLEISVLGHDLRVSPGAFYQVNLELNELMVRWAVGRAMAAEPERLLDMYCGIGNFAVPVAAQGVPVVGVELEGPSIRDLRHTGAELPIKALGMDARRFDPSREPYDVVILDPPRAGTGKVLQAVARNRPRRMVYVSCHLPSAVRELRQLKGYRVSEVRCFDMFPDTPHFETGIVLDRA